MGRIIRWSRGKRSFRIQPQLFKEKSFGKPTPGIEGGAFKSGHHGKVVIKKQKKKEEK